MTERPEITTKKPDITVVVCTHNRAEMLREALESLSRLHLPDGMAAEILVVDNASTDNTPAVVREVAEKSPLPVRYVFEQQPGIVPARNRGVNEAEGQWIAFFDDDQLADENWLRELYAAAVAEGVKMVGGAVWLKLPAGCRRNLSPVCRMLLGETVGRTTACDYDYRFTPGTGNLMLHRSVLTHIGLFDPRLRERGEDTDLFLRAQAAGYRGRYTPRAVIHHVIPPERLSDTFLLKLSRLMADGMAEDEWRARGRRLYPFVWLARLAQLVFTLWPRWLWAVLTRNPEARLGMRCRLVIARSVLRDGWQFIFTPARRRPPVTSPSPPAEENALLPRDENEDENRAISATTNAADGAGHLAPTAVLSHHFTGPKGEMT